MGKPGFIILLLATFKKLFEWDSVSVFDIYQRNGHISSLLKRMEVVFCRIRTIRIVLISCYVWPILVII